MAIKVSGTTIVDDSRNLYNINSVDSITATAIGNAGVGGGLLKELYTTTFSNSASVTVTPTNIGSTTYEEYEVHGFVRLHSANYWILCSRVYTGTTLHTNSTYTSQGNTKNFGWANLSQAYFAHSHTSNQNYSDAYTPFPFRIVYSKETARAHVQMYSWMVHYNGSNQAQPTLSGGSFTSGSTSSEITGFNFFSNTGTGITGKLWVYGVDR